MRFFRLKCPTIAIRLSNCQAVIVLGGDTITLKEDPAWENRGDAELVDVEWNGTEIQMFACDIRDRGEEI